ncbi:hypothetical protein C8R48DRAFT_672171 [Suillus tomentosus]|nr:hypothetical protein C8R48DRAFT_672171 [Suillus tomentosus]
MPHNALGLCFSKHVEEAHAAQEAALQHGINQITSAEAAMEVEQGTQTTVKVKPVKPCARPVKKKLDGVVAANELTSSSLPVASALANKDQGGIKSQGAGGIREGSSRVVGNKITKPPKKMKKKLHEAATRQILDSDQTEKKGNHVLKKFGLIGKVNNWKSRLDPETKSTVSPVVRAELEPSGDSAWPHAASSTKRTIEEARLIGSSEDYDPDDIEEEEEEADEFVTDPSSMLVDEESSSIAEVLKPTRTTTKCDSH